MRRAVYPEERVATVEEMRAQSAAGLDRLLLVAELDGQLSGSGLAGRSSLGCARAAPRAFFPTGVRHGVGTALDEVLWRSALAEGFREAVAFVEDDGSLAFALRLGYREVDRQVEQIRTLDGTEQPPALPSGVEIFTVAERPELLCEAYPLAVEAYAAMATFRPVTVTLDEWQRDEATLPDGSFVALAGDEVVGYSGSAATPTIPHGPRTA